MCETTAYLRDYLHRIKLNGSHAPASVMISN